MIVIESAVGVRTYVPESEVVRIKVIDDIGIIKTRTGAEYFVKPVAPVLSVWLNYAAMTGVAGTVETQEARS